MGVVHKVMRQAASLESQMANRRAAPPSPMTSPPAPAPAPAAASSSSSAASKYPRFGRRGAPQAFPSKLYEILEGENPDIIGWTATGRGFEVRDHARLSSEVLGRFFKQDKFSSFQRQLNLYGFRKITKGSESGSYQHPHFRRGERTTLLTIRRSTKASPARVVVPVSPASTGSDTPPPAIPLNNDSVRNKNNGGFSAAGASHGFSGHSSSTAGTNMSTTKANGTITTNNNNQPRSATPSPPPATVSRGVLWPRPPVLDTGASRQQQQQHAASGAREVSPDGSGMNKTTTAPPADRRQQQWSPPTAAASSSNSWESHADRSRVAGPGGDVAAADASAPGGGGVGGAPAERSALDHQDAEVVSLLQRMAREAQDSPSRKRAALAAQRWEGAQQLHHSASSDSSSQQHLQQPQFQMPRPAPGAAEGSDESGQSQQTVFAERLYDILSHERGGGAHPPGYYPSSFGADGRGAPGFPPHLQQHHHLQRNDPPSSYSTAPTASPSSNGSPTHQSVRNDSFESAASAHHGAGGGGSSGEAGDGGDEMGMSDQDRQILLARCRSGPSSAAATAAAAEQDRQVLLARSRSGPADFNRDDHHHHYYHSNGSSNNNHHYRPQQRQDGGGLVFDYSPNRGGEGTRGGGEYSFEGTRYGSHSSGPGGVLPPLPSLNFEQFGGGGGGGVDRMRRAPWHGAADSTYVK